MAVVSYSHAACDHYAGIVKCSPEPRQSEDAGDQAERMAMRASDQCCVLTRREAISLRDELIRAWTLPEILSATLGRGDLSRAWVALNNQIDALAGDVDFE
jgi:hypothetical protein